MHFAATEQRQLKILVLWPVTANEFRDIYLQVFQSSMRFCFQGLRFI